MSEIIKQGMADIWASSGDIVAPDAGKVAEGWLVEVVPRQYWNWMQNRTDVNLAYMLQHGIPEWDAITEFIANKSYVQHAGIVYKAILTGINQNPTTATTYWSVAFVNSTAALEALKATVPASDKLPYFTGTSTAATTTLTPLARTLLDDTTRGEMLTTIGAQAADATLSALAGIATATNKLPYFTGVDTVATTDLTAFGRSLIDDSDAVAARVTLGLNNLDNTSDANKPVSTAQQAALDLKAPLASPALTGTPTAPTAPTGNSSTQVATTAFVSAEITNDRPYSSTVADIKMNGAQSLGSSASIPRADHVHPTDTTRAPLDSPALTGVPTAPTPVVGSNTIQVATSAFVQANAAIKDSDTGSVQIPSGTTAQRTAVPTYGRLRANSTLNSMEWWNGVVWTPVGSGAGATGAGSGLGQDQIFNETDQLVTDNWTIGQGSMLTGATITIASPAVITFASHSFVVNQPVRFTTTGALPTGLTVNTPYYVIATGLTANTFQVSTTQGGAAVVTTGTQSGVHSVGKLKNALVTKELKIASGKSVTIPSGSSLVVVGAGGKTENADLYVNTFNAQDISGVKNFTSPPTLNGFDLTSIGIGQTWQDVIASRTILTNYTNTTGRPICVSLMMTGPIGFLPIILVGGIKKYGTYATSSSQAVSVDAIVPPGQTYQASYNTGPVAIFKWMELR